MAKQRIIFSNLKSGYNCHEDCDGGYDCDCDSYAIDAERMNLNIQVDGEIIGIATVGTWRGNRTGYQKYGTNIRNILSTSCDSVEWYSDGRNIKATMHHHDGTNYVEYRVAREGRNIDKLLEKLYNQEEVTRQMINYYTKSLHPYVAKVYGW